MYFDQDIAISVSGISKTFLMKPSKFEILRSQFSSNKKPPKSVGSFTALDDINFEVQRGRTFGIMGHNGSGKSTLLQLICGIMTPSAGKIITDGKVAALLELGSGFNPEFTGIENIFLNGSILGMNKEQIENKLDDILNFADIGNHVYAPVRTYSSGMMLRLAFATQVAVEPDILIVDEALAVGDVKFQNKCFRRLNQLKSDGTSILLVSHATELVKSFCDDALVLEHGKQIYLGDASSATRHYYAALFPQFQESKPIGESTPKPFEVDDQIEKSRLLIVSDFKKLASQSFGLGGAEVCKLIIESEGLPIEVVGGQEVSFTVLLEWEPEVVMKIIENEGLVSNITAGIAFSDVKGVYLFGANGFDENIQIDPSEKSKTAITIKFIMPYLLTGDYLLTLAVAAGDQKNNVQLVWYDSFQQLKCSSGHKNVHGLFAIDYKFSEEVDQYE